MSDFNERSHWWPDRIAVAWMIQLGVILWIGSGAAGQCNVNRGGVSCHTTQGDIGLTVPVWLGR